MPFQLQLSDKEVATDPVAALFRASVLMTEHALNVRNRANGTTVDVGNGKSGVVCSVDSSTMHVKCNDGTRHTVPFNHKRLTQLADAPSSAKKTSTTTARRNSPKRGGASSDTK